MDLQILYFILGIAGAIIIILLGVIGFFLKMIVRIINSLEETVNKLIKSVTILETNDTNTGIGCIEKHQTITTRLNDHSKRLNDHDKKITELSVKTNLKVHHENG